MKLTMRGAKVQKSRRFSFRLVFFLLNFCILWVTFMWYWWRRMQNHLGSPHGKSHSHDIVVANLKETNLSPPNRNNVVDNNRVSVDEHRYDCPNGLIYVANVPQAITETSKYFRIPRRVFQTSKSKCVDPSMIAGAMKKWQFEGWEYYLYDDQNVDDLFQQQHDHDFPLLSLIAKHCFVHGTLKADVWRYLVLWLYGGLYVDMDSKPTSALRPEMISSDDHDALFVIEQYHLLSQYFIAISPKHPLMKYAIEDALQNVLQHDDVCKINAAFTTGPHALHSAFRRFCRSAGAEVDPALPGYKPVHAGTYFGSFNRSVTAIGVAEDQNHYIIRDYLSGGKRKARMYQRMGMRHFSEDAQQNASGISCRQLILSSKSQKDPS